MRPVVRVTQLEQFRKWMSGEYEYVTEQSVMDSLTGVFTGNDKTRIGTAFHSIVETGSPVCEKVDGGRAFDIDGHRVTLGIGHCKVALDYRDEFPSAFHEVRLSKDYGAVTVTGCADMVDGLELRDIKTRFSRFTADGYADSCQGMFYMDMFGARAFHYDVFEFVGYKEDMGMDVRGCALRRHEPVTTYAPMGAGELEADCRRLVREFMGWINAKGMVGLIMREGYGG